MNTTLRLQAYLSRSGAAPSRRKAEALITAGRVKINGRTASLGQSVGPDDSVILDGQQISLPDRTTTLALNKPAGYLTTMSDDRGRPTVADLMPAICGLAPAGRLDMATTGLLLLTNDGELAHRLTHPSFELEKEYLLTLSGYAPDEAIEALKAGPTLSDGPMAPPHISSVRRTTSATTLYLTTHEGRNRIVRRACEAVGLHLTRLRRVRVGPVLLSDLAPGDTRPLTPDELRLLRAG